jgi:hypothetical protein
MSKRIKVPAEKVRNLLASSRVILRDHDKTISNWEMNDLEDPQGNLWDLFYKDKHVQIDFEAPDNEQIEYNPLTGKFWIFETESEIGKPVAYQFLKIVGIDSNIIPD